MEHGQNVTRINFSLPSPRALVKIADQKREERLLKRKEDLEKSSKVVLSLKNKQNKSPTSKVRKFFMCLCCCCCYKRSKQVHPTDYTESNKNKDCTIAL